MPARPAVSSRFAPFPKRVAATLGSLSLCLLALSCATTDEEADSSAEPSVGQETATVGTQNDALLSRMSYIRTCIFRVRGQGNTALKRTSVTLSIKPNLSVDGILEIDTFPPSAALDSCIRDKFVPFTLPAGNQVKPPQMRLNYYTSKEAQTTSTPKPLAAPVAGATVMPVTPQEGSELTEGVPAPEATPKG